MKKESSQSMLTPMIVTPLVKLAERDVSVDCNSLIIYL